MCLTWCQEERKRIAQGVDQRMEFGAQSAFAAPDRLVVAVFFWAPALCWCARTIVLSIMAYSLSASAAKISNTFFHTPPLAQRENRVCILIGSPKTVRQVPPGHASTKAIDHGLRKQSIVLRRNPH